MADNGVEGPGVRYEWESVRESYVEGVMDAEGGLRWFNLREVAELHGVPYNRTRERASREGWQEQRAAFQGQLEHARRSERTAEAVREATALDAQSLLAAKAGLTLVTNRLMELAEQVKERSGAGQDPSSEWVEPIDSRELATLARAANEWRNLGAASLGLPTDRSSIELSGPGGTPIDLREELLFDDPDNSRITGILVTMERSGLLPDPGGEARHPGGVDPQDPERQLPPTHP